MNKILVIVSVTVVVLAIYLKRKSDEATRKYQMCQRRLLAMQRAQRQPLGRAVAPEAVARQPVLRESPMDFEMDVNADGANADDVLNSDAPSDDKPQLLNLATTALTPLIAFIGPNLLKKKSNFLNEMDASDFSLAQQLKEMNESEPKIVELEDESMNATSIEYQMANLVEESKSIQKKLVGLEAYAMGGDLPTVSDFTFIDDAAEIQSPIEDHFGAQDEAKQERIELEMSAIQKELEQTIETIVSEPIVNEQVKTVNEPVECKNGVCPIQVPKKRGRKPKIESVKQIVG
jgi:hypothetical protein